MSMSHASCSHERSPKARAACRAAAAKGTVNASVGEPDGSTAPAASVTDPQPEPTAVAAAEATKPARVAAGIEQGFARVRAWATTARDGGLTVEQTMDDEGGTEVIISSPNGTSGQLRIRYTSRDRRTTTTRTVPDNPSKPVPLKDVNALVNSWVHAQA